MEREKHSNNLIKIQLENVLKVWQTSEVELNCIKRDL